MWQYNKKNTKKIIYDDVTKEKKINKYNLNCPRFPDHSHRIWLTEGTGSGKTNALVSLIQQQDGEYSIIDKSYLCFKDIFEAKYQYPINHIQDGDRGGGEKKGLSTIVFLLTSPNVSQKIWDV